MSIQEKLTAAVDAINEAKKINDAAQRKYPLGTTEWHVHERIDDKLHDALANLGQ